jgi:hypothetical protein
LWCSDYKKHSSCYWGDDDTQTSRLATGEMMTRTAASRGARQPRVRAGCHLVSRAPVSVSMYYIQYSIIVLAPSCREEPRAVGLVRTYLG